MYLAWRVEAGYRRPYALKRMHAHLQGIDRARQMFMREARLAGAVRHANVVSVLDVGEDDEGPYLVMDLVEGESLADRLEDQGPLPCGEAAELIRKLALALHYITPTRA